MHSWSEPDAETATFLRSLDASAFHEHVLVADPHRVVVVERSTLAAALPARRAAFTAAGIGEPRLTHAECLPLDDRHLLVSGTWTAGPVDLESTYLLRRTPDGLRAIAYVNHRDVESALAAGT
jgi:hypothetical protein